MPEGKMMYPPIPTIVSEAIASAAAQHSSVGLRSMEYTSEVDDKIILHASSLELLSSSVCFLQGELGSEMPIQIRRLRKAIS